MKRYFVFLFFSIVMIILSVSCSTTLKMYVIRPAKVDLNGAKTIGILPFSQSKRFPFYNNGGFYVWDDFEHSVDVGKVEQRVLSFLHSEIERGIADSPYVTLVSSVVVENEIKNGRKNPADIYVLGEMVTFDIFDNEKIVKRNVKENEEKKSDDEKNEEDAIVPELIYESFYTREVLLVFNYQIVESNSNNVLFFDTFKINNKSDFVDSFEKLPDPYSMISYELDKFVSSILKLLQPYDIVRNISLLGDKSKNPEMESADKLARDGRLMDSFNAFYHIYDETGLFEAGYNGAMVLMVLGELEKAEDLMRRVYSESGNVKAKEGLADIMNEIRQKKILDKQAECYRREGADVEVSEK